MNKETLLPLVIPLLLALCGYLFTYFYGMRQEGRKSRLARINEQLNQFYGPLLAIVQSSQQAWENFIGKYDDNPDFYKKQHNPTPEQVAEFHNWMRTVFMPNNNQLHNIIVNSTSLLIEDEIPRVLLDLMAHIMEFRINFEARPDEHAEVAESRSKYPGQPLLKYCEKSFRDLKSEQIRIIKKGR